MRTTKRIRGVLVDTSKGVKKMSLANSNIVSTMTKMLGCTFINSARRVIKGERALVFYDTEFLSKTPLAPAVVTRSKETLQVLEVIYGNCFICDCDKHGEPRSLTKKKIDVILSSLATITLKDKQYTIVQAE